jgi:hypothetical protein
MLRALVLLSLVASPHDAAWVEALQGVYDGGLDRGLANLEALSKSHPGDPLGPYFVSLALAWKIEGGGEGLDGECLARADQALSLADAALREDHDDARAWLARGGAHGVRSRLALFRGRHSEAAHEAARMREALLVAHTLDPSSKDAVFGLGLYDYFVDVLPRLAKLLRFLTGMPPGDRGRGLQEIEEAREGAVFHRAEALAQISQLDAVYERRLDRALGELQELRASFPGSPLWALRLGELEGSDLGLYPESERLAGEVLAASERREANYAPIVGLMARVLWGQALFSDLRFPEARQVLEPALGGDPKAPWIAPRAEFLYARCLEYEGRRQEALPHYRNAAAAGSGAASRRAEEALGHPLPPAEIRSTEALARGRRAREAGLEEEARAAFREALRLRESPEALLRVAEADLDEDRPDAARGPLEHLSAEATTSPPWVGPWSRLLLGRLDDLRGQREAAVRLYKDVYQHPLGQEALKDGATSGLDHPFAPVHPR